MNENLDTLSNEELQRVTDRFITYVREALSIKNMQQKELSKELGWDYKKLNRYLNHKQPLSLKAMVKIAAWFNEPLEEMIRDDNDKRV